MWFTGAQVHKIKVSPLLSQSLLFLPCSLSWLGLLRCSWFLPAEHACGHLSARLHSHPRGPFIFFAVSRVMVWWHLEHWVETIDAKPSLSSPVNMTEPPHCVEYMLNSVIYCYFFYIDDSWTLNSDGCVGGGMCFESSKFPSVNVSISVVSLVSYRCCKDTQGTYLCTVATITIWPPGVRSLLTVSIHHTLTDFVTMIWAVWRELKFLGNAWACIYDTKFELWPPMITVEWLQLYFLEPK